ncbi:MAG: hypothetical protein ACFE9D_08100 [Promethearchaeota archaeon]
MSLDPDDFNPLARREPQPIHPKDPRHTVDADIVTLLRQLMIRVERLEEDMRKVKEKLNL